MANSETPVRVIAPEGSGQPPGGDIDRFYDALAAIIKRLAQESVITDKDEGAAD